MAQQPTRGPNTGKVAANRMARPQSAAKPKIAVNYTRKQVLEALIYELKPFVISLSGVALAIYFTERNQSIGKFCALTLVVSGAFIFYSRAKARGMIH